MAITQTAFSVPGISRANRGLVWLGIAVIGMLIFYWAGISALPNFWSRPEYSHGYLIPLLALYLLLVQLQREPSASDKSVVSHGLGLAIVVLGLGVGLFGNFVKLPDFTIYGLIICLAGLLLVVVGTQRGLRFWAPVAFLLFMLPLPNFLYWPLSLKFQLFSSEIGVAILSFLGVPVFLDGNIIDLGTYKLHVAEACSGLRYLFPLMSFGFLFAVLYKGPTWHKFLLFASTLPLTILMNSVRIALTGILVDKYGVEQAEGFLHFFEGWVVFLLCVLILYGIAALLQRLVTTPALIYTMVESDFAALGRRLARIRHLPTSHTLVLVSVCIFLAGIVWHLTPARAVPNFERDPLALFPLELGTWRGEKHSLEPDVAKALSADDYLLASYKSDDVPVNLLVVYFASQAQGNSIHSPAVCLPGGGWEVSGWRRLDTGVRTHSGQTLQVNRAVIQKGTERQLVYYWFEQRGRSVTNDYAAKAYTAWDLVNRGRTDGALVRVITPIGPGGDQAADIRLKGFLEEILPALPRFVPS